MFQGKNFIYGEFIGYKGEHFSAIDPATENVYGTFPQTGPDEVKYAVESARNAFHLWKRESRVRRGDLFDTLAQLLKINQTLLVDAIVTETGKSFNEARAEVIEALHMCQYAASMGRQPYGEVVASELPTKDSYVIRKPRGVVAVISPWNFPLAIGSFWCAAPAIVEGNTVVHKPSELTPMVNQIVAGLYQEAGFPNGVFNLIHGDGRSTGSTLVDSDVDVILFTGSAEVAKHIKSRCVHSANKTCSVECGSKSAMMIFDDGDINLAVEASIASAFKLTGQRCVSSGRLLVQRTVLDKFIEKFTEKAESVFVGNPHLVPAPYCGPLISKEQMERVKSFNEMVRNDPDAKIILDRDGTHGYLSEMVGWNGYYLRPFVYTVEWSNKPYLKSEVFGPHVAIIPFDDVHDAIRIYNDTEYGLSLGVISDDYRIHRTIAQNCDTGMLYINGSSIGAESHLPFSSWKKSGWGASASATWKAVTHTMAVTVNYEEGKVQFAQGLK